MTAVACGQLALGHTVHRVSCALALPKAPRAELPLHGGPEGGDSPPPASAPQEVQT